MDDINAITPTSVITVPQRFDNLRLSKKKKIAAPIIATEINQNEPPTISCGNNSLFILSPKKLTKKKLLTSIVSYNSILNTLIFFIYIFYKLIN